jgi:hypothetical protein
MSTTITRRGLDAQLRANGATAYRLTPACHPTAGVELVYAGDGRLLVWCHRCHGDVAQLAVGGLAKADPPCS